MSLTWSAHISWLFGELPYLERVRAACEAGFQNIETAWPQSTRDCERLPDAVAEQGVQVVLLNCNAGDAHGGERGFLNDSSRREEAERDFLAAADLAQRLGAANLNLLVGRALPDVSLTEQRGAVVDALRAFAPEARARGLRILLEPINEIENGGYLLPTPAAAAELIEECGSDGLRILFDVYHVACAGDDPRAAIKRCGPLIGHVQISDFPGRGHPGSGELPMAEILEELAAGGYEGCVGLEYAPGESTGSSLAFLGEARYPVQL
ncbi:MAG: hydroxypyruvate isomerase family protein [Solirubrobacteraceae bacterium]